MWGGKRDGSGRPKVENKKVQVLISLSKEQVDKIKKDTLPEGTISKKIMFLLNLFYFKK